MLQRNFCCVCRSALAVSFIKCVPQSASVLRMSCTAFIAKWQRWTARSGHNGHRKNSLLLNTFLSPILGLIILGNVRVAEIFRGFNLIEICRLVKYKFQHKWPTLTLVKAEVLCWIFIRERHYNFNCILYLVHDSFNSLSCCHFPPFLQSRQLWIIVICEGYEVALNSLRVFPWRIRKLQNVCSRLTPQDLF